MEGDHNNDNLDNMTEMLEEWLAEFYFNFVTIIYYI